MFPFSAAQRRQTRTLAPRPVVASGPAAQALVARVAAQQHGLATLAQLLDAGLSASAVRRRVAAGWLHRIHPAVYAVGHAGLTDDGRRLAAVLACGPEALLSHLAAGVARGFVELPFRDLDVTTTALGRRGPPGVRLHRSRVLADADQDELRGVPITSVARTLVDLAGVLTPARLAGAVDQAEVLGLLDRGAVRDALGRASRRRGTGRLRALVGEPANGDVRSRLEADFRRLCRRHGLPLPEFNAPLEVSGRRIVADGLYREVGLIVEVDGEGAHLTRRAFHDDRARDVDALAAGLVVIRFTRPQIRREQERVATRLRAILTRLAHPAFASEVARRR